jgi:hypothetical protein
VARACGPANDGLGAGRLEQQERLGQSLDIKNSDPLMHNIKTHPKQNRPFNVSQPSAGMTLTRHGSRGDAAVPMQRAWLDARVRRCVVASVLRGDRDAGGRFSITGLPPGTYTIEAWHEKYGTRTATVTVQKNETKTVDLTYTAQ